MPFYLALVSIYTTKVPEHVLEGCSTTTVSFCIAILIAIVIFKIQDFINISSTENKYSGKSLKYLPLKSTMKGLLFELHVFRTSTASTFGLQRGYSQSSQPFGQLASQGQS